MTSRLSVGVNRAPRSRYHKYTGKQTPFGTAISKCGKLWLHILRVTEKEIQCEYPKLTRCPMCWSS